jgi:hypothetical protein
LPYGIHGGFVAMLTSLFLYISVSLLSKKDELAPDMAKVMSL